MKYIYNESVNLIKNCGVIFDTIDRSNLTLSVPVIGMATGAFLR